MKFKQNLSDAKKAIDVIGTIKKSPYCQQHLAAITEYQKSNSEMRAILDDQARNETLPSK